MVLSSEPIGPYFLHERLNDPSVQGERELSILVQLTEVGVTVAPTVIVPASVEDQFYRLNNLPEQLANLFRWIDPRDPDEDDLEDVVTEVQALLRSHYLLDEFIDPFYRAIQALPATVRVRRTGSGGNTVVRGRPTLMALKDLWFEDWSLESVRLRLETYQQLTIDKRSVLIQPPRELLHLESPNAKKLNLDPSIVLYEDPEYGVTRVQLPQYAPENASR
jgi:hypothetical protein